MSKVLIVEDEAHVVSFIRKGLTEEGFETTVAMDGNTGIELFNNSEFDIVVLDIMLPGLNGYEVCRRMKEIKCHVPVLFLTALGTAENVALGLNTGADDYLVKPFKFIEFLARIRSLLRRTAHSGHGEERRPTEQRPDVLSIGNLELDDYSKTVKKEGKVISLTATEYRLLHCFLKNQNRVLSRIEILDNVWGVNFDMGTNVVDVYVNYLRKKLDQVSKEKLIHTVVGMGYVLKKSD